MLVMVLWKHWVCSKLAVTQETKYTCVEAYWILVCGTTTATNQAQKSNYSKWQTGQNVSNLELIKIGSTWEALIMRANSKITCIELTHHMMHCQIAL